MVICYDLCESYDLDFHELLANLHESFMNGLLIKTTSCLLKNEPVSFQLLHRLRESLLQP